MYSTVESIESATDVVIHFSEEEWQMAKQDIDWATSVVIKELKSHKSCPEEYFASKPFWAARVLSWNQRIKIEIKGHIWTNDRDIRFSEWWIVKLFR